MERYAIVTGTELNRLSGEVMQMLPC